MQYVPPIGGDPNDPYIDADPGAAVEGSAVPAAAIEHAMRELVALITDAGLDPSGANLAQVAAAVRTLIQSQAAAVAVAGGTADAVTAAFTPAITTDTADRIPTATLMIVAAAANTGAGLTIDAGTGAFGVVKGAGAAIVSGDVHGAGHIIMIRGIRGADAAADRWQLLNPARGVAATLAPIITYLTSGVGAAYVPTPGAKEFDVEVVGGGGGGGGADGQGANTSATATSGGGGAYARKRIANLNQTFTYTIGSGGVGGAAAGGDGANGGTTSFVCSVNGTIQATGGAGGVGMVGTAGTGSGNSGASGGTASGGDLNLNGGGSSGRSVVSGYVNSTSLSGAAPVFGGNVRAAHNTMAGENGINYGAGGSGANAYNTSSNYAGGNGAPGAIRITEYF